ncbi:MAG: 3'-5' exonuclease, partial [Parvularculaceae bacterium]
GAFAFFSHLLETGAPSGRRRLYARLGEVSAEPIAELLRQALDYERRAPRSLQGFLVWAEKNAGEIKRDMEKTSETVRVMTVHGAKGLEAEIVFLLDAHRGPHVRNLGPLFFAGDGKAPLPVLSVTKESDSAAARGAREETRRLAFEEYRRLLYVAATRARDRLYVCGLAQGRNGDPQAKEAGEKTWHALAKDAFAHFGARATAAGETSWGGAIRRIEATHPAAVKAVDRASSVIAPPPSWLATPAPFEAPPLRLAPSRLADDSEAKAEAPAFSPSRPTDIYLRGRVLHKLLELLPEIPPTERRAVADRLLGRLAPEIAADERARWREEALAVLADDAFAAVFGPTSRAEVAIAGRPKGAKAGLIVSGQIDRLAVEASRVLIVDYKTNRPPPKRLEDTPEGYLAQLAAYRALLRDIYPDKSIEAALLWTYEARLSAIPAAMLDHAFARFLA